LAAYSPRSGTLEAKEFEDTVPAPVKKERLISVEKLQEEIVSAINAKLIGTDIEILVEGNKGGKWYGRTRTDKLVFFKHIDDCAGRLVKVRITKAGAWSLQGDIIGEGN
jgi:tRNA-2-methylthio-N6-dimethylallyladenosine synthase